MRRRGKFLFFAGLMFALFFSWQPVWGYDHSIAHPGIADLAVKLYNSQNEIQINSKQAEYILQGANSEDTPIRWFNHFYDPIYNVGFSDFIMGEKLGIFPTAPAWLQSPYEQTKYSVGDRSWQRAIDDYARGDEEKAFLGLGHAIHLISDMSVPAHTRNSAHPGDSYESFVKSNWKNIAPGLKYEFRELNSLEQAFRDLAEFSNNNFYSDRTIESKKYNIIEIKEVKRKKVGEKFYDFNYSNNNFLIYIQQAKVGWNKENYFELSTIDPLNTNLVLTDYSQTLIPQAISYSSGLIKLFLEEAEAKKEQMQYEKMSWWQKINNILFNDELPIVRQTVEGYVMEKTLAPAIEFGGDVLDKAREIKETVEKIAQKNQEPEIYEKLIPETKATSTTFITSTTTITSTTFITTTTLTTTTTTTTSTTITTSYYSSGGGSLYIPPAVEPTTTPEIELDLETPTPELFLELLQTTTTNFITLNFSSSETSSLPVSFEGEYSTSTFWNSLFPWTTSTAYIFETNKSGDYTFRVRVIDGVYNTSTWAVVSTTVPVLNYEYNYLDGYQEEELVVLTKEGSPYIIRDFYYFGAGQTLRMEPGTVVKGATINNKTYGNIIFAGNLEVLGTEEEKVIITSVADHSFDNDRMNTLGLNIPGSGLTEGLRAFDGAVLKMENFEIRNAGEPFDNGDVKLAAIITYSNNCLDVSGATVNIKNGIFKDCGKESSVYLYRCNGTISNSFFSSNRNGLHINQGNLVLSDLKFSGYNLFPFTIRPGSNVIYNNLIFENNRLNGIFDRRKTGAVVVSGDSAPVIFSNYYSDFRKITSISAEPGAQIYFDGLLNIPSSLQFIGTPEKRIKVYFTEIFDSGVKLKSGDNTFKYVDFINTSPFLEQRAKNYYSVSNSYELISIPWERSWIFGPYTQRHRSLKIQNGTLNLEEVNFINGVTPSLTSISATSSALNLKNVNFYNSKEYGDLFYLEETQTCAIEAAGGEINLDNVNFSDLVYGVYYNTSSGYLSPTITLNNMSKSNFDNVLYKSFPEDLMIFSESTSTPEIPTTTLLEDLPPPELSTSTTSTILTEEVTTSTSEGEDILVE